ncbi:hypothetical protein EVAR_22049_1 [Eumeta japonica]|uniref:Uncharacterized protein n=1 Tax=Eumeta variegata TaxID=151549 RepID=A0A4C1UTS8_EUMVA|nr:hypothetical protein EVAR_22049_1 [Eumeta japonica]
MRTKYQNKGLGSFVLTQCESELLRRREKSYRLACWQIGGTLLTHRQMKIENAGRCRLILPYIERKIDESENNKDNTAVPLDDRGPERLDTLDAAAAKSG